MNNDDKLIIITGAGGDIGLNLVQHLCETNFNVVAIEYAASALEKLKQIQSVYSKLLIFKADITQYDKVQAIATKIQELYTHPMITLVNLAGIFAKTPTIKNNSKMIDKLIDINLKGSLYSIEIFSRIMIATKKGKIINIASIAGIQGSALAAAYAASKAGMIAAGKSFARELAPFGISVNTIAPGFCDTKMMDDHKYMLEKFLLPTIPARRFSKPCDVTELILFLISCETNYLTGATIPLDGGLTVG